MSAILLFLIALLLGIVIHRECSSREGWGMGWAVTMGWGTQNQLRGGGGHSEGIHPTQDLPGSAHHGERVPPCTGARGISTSLGCGKITGPSESYVGSPWDLHTYGVGWERRTWGWLGFLNPFPALQPFLPAGAELSLLFPGHRADIPAATRCSSRSPACPWRCRHHYSTHPKGPPGPQDCCHSNPELAAYSWHGSTG